jgi:hypothetical protein
MLLTSFEEEPDAAGGVVAAQLRPSDCLQILAAICHIGVMLPVARARTNVRLKAKA